MIQKPPDWKQHFSGDLFTKAIASDELQQLIKKAERDYLYWDKFKYQNMPAGFTAKDAWTYLKFTRLTSKETTPVVSVTGEPFGFKITKSMYQQIASIDANTSGMLQSEYGKPTASDKNQLLVSALTEEAIASSQIEGANTSRKVAKDMLLSQRKAKTRDEQMIINNYQVMQRLLDWKDVSLSEDMLIDVQRTITDGTLDDEGDVGRLRTDEDDIHVINRATGEIIFTPPPMADVHRELDRLIKYANTTEVDEEFIHPVIKASILHFWLAYLHPFVDGNGRTARALFYWYLLRQGYWGFQYLSVSRIIKKSKTQYDNSFEYAEKDESDLTYFLVYNLRAIILAIRDFQEHYEEKVKKDKVLAILSTKTPDLNDRQLSLLHYLDEHRDARIDVKTHQAKYRLAYESARTDLMGLYEKGFLHMMRSGRKYLFVPNTSVIKKLFVKAA